MEDIVCPLCTDSLSHPFVTELMDLCCEFDVADVAFGYPDCCAGRDGVLYIFIPTRLLLWKLI
jgi:hypothetical protein